MLLLALCVSLVATTSYTSENCIDTDHGAFRTHCEFTNICYDPSQPLIASSKPNFGYCLSELSNRFVFYPSPDHPTQSVHSVGVTSFESCHQLTPSIANHSNGCPVANVQWIEHTVFGVYRQQRHNYFHALLDDLLGLFWQVRTHDMHHHPETYALMALEPRQHNDPFNLDALSRAFSTQPLLFLHDIISAGKSLSNTITCFRRLILGSGTRGYGIPGHTLLREDDVPEFSRFLVANMGLEQARPSKPLLVLIKRTDRLIVNERQLVSQLQAKFPALEIQLVALEKLSFQEQAALMRRTTILMGVHGAGLTNLMFLNKGAFVVEIFQWHFTRPVYERLARQLGLSYVRWANEEREKTVFHESILDTFQLNEADRKKIRDARERPYWLPSPLSLAGEKYWINQDTVVDITALQTIVEKALGEGLSREVEGGSEAGAEGELRSRQTTKDEL